MAAYGNRELTPMTAGRLIRELKGAGWTCRKMAVLAARFYTGLESKETLSRYLTDREIEYIVDMR